MSDSKPTSHFYFTLILILWKLTDDSCIAAAWGDPSSDQDMGHVSIDGFFAVCVDRDYVCDGKLIVTPRHREYLDPWAWAAARSIHTNVYLTP